uniref:Uncharacterized protein n=1 Tax=Macrostomum lignano TaxID=282301 RepID=A0A1I8IWZ0_9PLAT
MPQSGRIVHEFGGRLPGDQCPIVALQTSCPVFNGFSGGPVTLEDGPFCRHDCCTPRTKTVTASASRFPSACCKLQQIDPEFAFSSLSLPRSVHSVWIWHAANRLLERHNPTARAKLCASIEQEFQVCYPILSYLKNQQQWPVLGGAVKRFLLHGAEFLAGLGELALLHALADVPVHEGALRVHEVELVRQPVPGLGNGGGVAQHADRSRHLREVASGHRDGRLVVDADLEAGGAPVHELDLALVLDLLDRMIDFIRVDVAPVQQAAGHVLSVPGVALHHLVASLKARVRDVLDFQRLVICLLRGNDGSIGSQWEVDLRVGHEVGLELGDVHIERAIEPQGHDIVYGLVVYHKGDVGMRQGAVGAQDGVVGLHHGRRNLRRRVDGELQLRSLAVLGRQPVAQQRGEAGARAAAKRVKDQEALQGGAVLRQPVDDLPHVANQLLADCVVASGVVVGGVLLA